MTEYDDLLELFKQKSTPSYDFPMTEEDEKYYNNKNIEKLLPFLTNLQQRDPYSSTTNMYRQIAAQDNPDYAQMIGDIYAYGDLQRDRNNQLASLFENYAKNKLNEVQNNNTLQQKLVDYAQKMQMRLNYENAKQQNRLALLAAKDAKTDKYIDALRQIKAEPEEKVEQTQQSTESVTPNNYNKAQKSVLFRQNNEEEPLYMANEVDPEQEFSF